MTIAVPANPSSKRQTGDISCLAKFVQWKSRVAPCFRKVQVEAIQRRGEQIAEIVNGLIEFMVNVGANKVDFSRAPQAFQRGNHSLTDSPALPFGVFGIFASYQLVVERAEALAYGTSLGLSRVGSQDRLDAHITKNLDNIIGGESSRGHILKRVGPEPAYGIGA